MGKIAFVTSQELQDLYHEDKLVVPLLEAAGHTVTPTIWTDPSLDWQTFDLVIIRSPWDYFKQPDEYRTWLHMCHKTKVKLLNPASAVLANIDKRYLLDFSEQGIPIVPTEYVESDSKVQLKSILNNNNWDKVVIKPVISGGSYDTWRSDSKSVENDESEFAHQKKKHSLFVQPFMSEIVNDGEYSVLYFNNKFSHAVIKRPKSGEYRIQEEFGGMYESIDLSKDILNQTQRIIDLVPENLLYARVDGVIREGQFLLMELEINEPSLYFGIVEESAQNFVDAVCEHVLITS